MKDSAIKNPVLVDDMRYHQRIIFDGNPDYIIDEKKGFTYIVDLNSNY